jgi:NAD(P)-dependent dehydrogenase (short-subunit alcohol dehydrogenase family)
MDVRLDGRIALVTGGSRGLGLAMARKFAQSGADVAIVARRADVLEQSRAALAAETGRKIWAHPCDTGRRDQIEAMFAALIREFGRVDILVNNAGDSKAAPFESVTDEEWIADFDIKLFAAIRLARLALPGMKQRRWGRIINILNTGAKAPRAAGAPTHVTRAAGLALTKILAGDGAPYNVLVNALMTGQIVTDQLERRWKKERPALTIEQYAAERGKAIPLGRMGTADEYANVACFLASDAASYVTGTAVNIDGGLSPVV